MAACISWTHFPGRIYDDSEFSPEKPDYAEAWYNKSAALASIGRVDDSIKARQRALELNPELKNAVDCKN
jgi:tetratricopeptide (TPR) repeat protein